jgi:hypothetical protein
MHALALPLPAQRPEGIARCFCGEVVTSPTIDSHILAAPPARHMKLTAERPFASPEAAARKLVEIAAGIEPVQDGRIHIDRCVFQRRPGACLAGLGRRRPRQATDREQDR